MSRKKVVFCDQCNKKSNEIPYADGEYPGGWFLLKSIELEMQYTDKKSDYRTLEVSYNKDPDFCSEACIIAWLKAQIRRLKAQRNKALKERE